MDPGSWISNPWNYIFDHMRACGNIKHNKKFDILECSSWEQIWLLWHIGRMDIFPFLVFLFFHSYLRATATTANSPRFFYLSSNLWPKTASSMGFVSVRPYCYLIWASTDFIERAATFWQVRAGHAASISSFSFHTSCIATASNPFLIGSACCSVCYIGERKADTS